MKRTATAKAPGKLYIAGEYAVVEPGHPAILIAVDQFLTVVINESSEQGTVHPLNYSEQPIPWKRKNGKLSFLDQKHSLDILERTLQLTEQYISETGKTFIPNYDVKITSELDNASGKKYGLGSSGAVTIATIRALLSFYDTDLPDLKLFKLACLIHQSLGSNGSMGDLASATYTGWIAYYSYNRSWVEKRASHHSITEMLEMDWPKLHIEPLSPPHLLDVLIGWTGSPASTTDLVAKVKQKRKENVPSYRSFLANSKACVEQLIQAFHSKNFASIQTYLRENRQLLNELSDSTGLSIETPLLHSLIAIAEEQGAAAKTSGAGGGDCGIALLEHSSAAKKVILTKWAEESIQPLDLHIYTKKNEEPL